MDKLYDLGLSILRVYDDGRIHIITPTCSDDAGAIMMPQCVGLLKDSAINLRDALIEAFPIEAMGESND